MSDANVLLTIDGMPVSVPKGTLLVEAAKRVRKEIPVYCYHTKLGPAGLCRVCLVEIEGMPKLQIACNTVVTDGMVVHTYNDKVNDGRRAILEFLLVNHPLDCPICDKGGECDLQDYAMAYGPGASRMAEPKGVKPKAVDLGPTIVLDEERCVVCQRCVRFDDLITRERSLVVKNRGHNDIIATATGEPYRSNYSGNVTELCPVGALTSKTYRFKSRPWDLKRTRTTCTQCSVGCQMYVDVRHEQVLRTMSVPEDDHLSDGWLCDRGRYNIGFYTDERRLLAPLHRDGDRFVQIEWSEALQLWADGLRSALSHGTAAVAVLGGGRLLNEEAFALQHLFRSRGIKALDWRGGRQRQATPGKHGGSYLDLERANAIVVVGQTPWETAPIMDLRIRKAVLRHGAQLIVVASHGAPAAVPALTVETVAEAFAALPPQCAHVALVWDGVDANAGAELFGAVPQSVEFTTYIAGEQGNARGAEAMGMHPKFGPGYAPVDGGPSFAELVRAGRESGVRALSILGANPLLHYPDRIALLEMLAGVPFVVVSELFMTETAQRANLILPALGSFEKHGTTLASTGERLAVGRALHPPPGPRSDLEMLAGLAERLGTALPPAREIEDHVARAASRDAGALQLGDAAWCGEAVASDRGTGAYRVAIQSRIFSGGGTLAFDARLDALEPLPEAAFSAEDARALGVETGDYVDLECEGRTMHDLLVEVREHLPRGVVALIGGLADAPANALGERCRAGVVNVRKADAGRVAEMAR